LLDWGKRWWLGMFQEHLGDGFGPSKFGKH
jgi:hypothetical protein